MTTARSPAAAVFEPAERMVLTTMGCALLCILLVILMGALSALYYLPPLGGALADAGISLVQLRPLHTMFASAWIYLGCVACMYMYLRLTFGGADRGERRRYRFHMICWGLAGLATIVTLLAGITSGREYIGVHPAISLLILVGWVAFVWTFIRRVRVGFWRRPVYVYMWTSGALFFLYAFAEGHAYLLPFVGSHPVADIQIQWKSCGSLVASFNQMAYGSLLFLGERSTGDKSIAQSRSAFALFGIGLLNSFTNFGHHTYHLPQDHLIKWIAFVVSMLEILILLSLLRDVASKMGGARRSRPYFSAAARFVSWSKSWNLFLLPIAILISIPSLNSLIHGTHVVMAHAMGSELAIDSYILLAAFAWMLTQLFPKGEVVSSVVNGPGLMRWSGVLNTALVGLVACLLLRGLATGLGRWTGRPPPGWMEAFPGVFATLGFVVGYALVRIVCCWAPLFREPLRHRLFRHDPRWEPLVARELERAAD